MSASTGRIRVTVGGADNRVRVYGLDGKLVETFLHDGPVAGVAFHPDGKRVVAGSAERVEIGRIDTEELTRLATLALEAADVLMIGDLPTADVFGPRALGIRAALVDPHDIHGWVDAPRFRDLPAFVDALVSA